MKKYILFLLLFSFSFLISSEIFASEQKQNITIQNNKIIVEGDIEFKSFREVPYEFEIFGNLIIGNQVKFKENITVHGDIKGGDYIISYKTISANNIELGNNFSGTNIVSQGDVKLYGFAKIHNGFNIEGNLDTGSNLLLRGNSKIGGDMTIGIDSKIYGTLYIYGNLYGKNNLDFLGDKLKIIGFLRALEKSEFYGRIYVDGLLGRRAQYTNNILITYIIENDKYTGLLGKIDPILRYDLYPYEVESILQRIQYMDLKIKNQRRYVLSVRNTSERIQGIETLKKLENDFITFIEGYISSHHKDNHKWRVIKRQREEYLEGFIYKITS